MRITFPWSATMLLTVTLPVLTESTEDKGNIRAFVVKVEAYAKLVAEQAQVIAEQSALIAEHRTTVETLNTTTKEQRTELEDLRTILNERHGQFVTFQCLLQNCTNILKTEKLSPCMKLLQKILHKTNLREVLGC